MEINTTQTIIIAIVVMLVLIALGIFTGVIPGIEGRRENNEIAGKTSIWLPESARYLENSIKDFKEENQKIEIDFQIIPDSAYEAKIINAMASNNAPDIWILSQSLIFKHSDKVIPIPFTSISERSFLDTFISAGEMYLVLPKKGSEAEQSPGYIIGLPVSIDPIVLFWNKDLFAGAGFSLMPTTWDQFVTYSQMMTILNEAGNIFQSGSALGEFQNIEHAKDIISLLILQTGHPIVDKETRNAVLNNKFDLLLNPVSSAIRFFNEFSNPRKVTYSWNFSMADSQDAFVSGRLAMYFGYASEYQKIIEKNPHLNFDVAEVPQIRDGSIKATYGQIKALVLSKNNPDPTIAFKVMNYLVSEGPQEKIQSATLRPSVLRSVLAKPTNHITLPIFTKSAIMAKTWIDPDTEGSLKIFKDMAQSVKTGQKDLSDSVQDAQIKMENLIDNN